MTKRLEMAGFLHAVSFAISLVRLPPPPTHKHTHKITEGHIPEEPEVQRDWKQYRQGMLGWLGAGLRRGRKSLPMLCYSAVTPSGSVRKIHI